MNTKICPLSRRGFLKGVAIGAGGCALGSSLIHPLEVMGQSTEGLEKIPMEFRWKVASGTYVNTTVKNWKYRYDKEGKEKWHEAQKVVAQGTGASMKGFANYLGFTGDDAKSIIVIWSTLLPIWAGPDHKYEIVEATAENALSGKYPLTRYLYVYVNKKPNAPLAPLELEFVKMMLSQAGQKNVIKDGYIPLPAKVVKKALESIAK